MEIKKVAVIGGGAAGFFAAISVKENHPSYQVILFEKTSKVLSKVRISGGGRCNVLMIALIFQLFVRHILEVVKN